MAQESCKYLGQATLARRECVDGCRGVKLVVFRCAVFKDGCTIAKHAADTPCCADCIHRDPGPAVTPAALVDTSPKRWSYGVTTVPERKSTLLPRTLESLKSAGFPSPRLFVDGVESGYENATYRWPRIGAFGNWWLGMVELYVRDPNADLYAMFQDDIVLCRNVREYIDGCDLPKKAYFNLMTFPEVQPFLAKPGWNRSSQKGLGAVALVFPKEVLLKLLEQRNHFIDRPMATNGRATRCIDGGIVDAMGQAGIREYVHSPSLVDHTGTVSVVVPGMERPPWWRGHGFLGEQYDAATSFLKASVESV